jgi:hypothetical protein
MGSVIRKQTLSGSSWEGEPYADPASGELRLVVDGDTAVLDWREEGLRGNRSCAFQVPARSLLLALEAAWQDAHPPDATSAAKANSSRVRDHDGRFARARRPWTAELDEQLRLAWTSAAGTEYAWRALESLARETGRTTMAVAARLRRLGYAPDLPGTLTDDTAPAPDTDPAAGRPERGEHDHRAGPLTGR